jgi:large subunit ribosomal protein L4
MAVVNVYNTKAEIISQIELREDIFNVPVKSSVLHSVVTMQLAKRRAGTASTKHRSDVKGSTRKLFRQKGTGRARRGDIKSPLLRGGGSVFGPDPRSYSYEVPKKVKKLALKMALSSKLQDKTLTVIDSIDLESIKTKLMVNVLTAFGIQDALIVSFGADEKLELSARNIPGVKVLRSAGLNVYDILKYNHLILLQPALPVIEGRLGQ